MRANPARLFVASAITVLTSACGGATHPVSPLKVTPARVPAFNVAGYPSLVVSGVYPQLHETKYAAVNAALTEAVVAEERNFSRLLRAEKKLIPPSARRAMHGGFKLSFKPSLVSASTTEVSALMSATECVPGATGCDFWLSATFRVPSGDPVSLRSLFSNPAAGLRALARAAEQGVLRSDRCVAAAPNKAGFLPNWRNYDEFALTPTGLAIGFSTSKVGFPKCGPVKVIIPVARIDHFLNLSGRRLLDGVRKPA